MRSQVELNMMIVDEAFYDTLHLNRQSTKDLTDDASLI